VPGLPRPDLPPGAHRDLVDALHDLHHRAGWPSLRTLARAAGCSHTTVSKAFSSPQLPSWGLVEVLVEAMGGDPAAIRTVWLVAGAPEDGAATPAPDLAGRLRELTAVRRHLETGSGMLLVCGEAGIGKSRLVDAARRAAQGVVVVGGACLPLSSETPLLPFADLLRATWFVDDGAWVTAALAACPPYVARSAHRILPEVTPDRPPDDTEDGWDRQRLFFAVGNLVRALYDLSPFALVIEDLHWGDVATLDLLEHLLSAPVPPPGIVATYRLDDPLTPPVVSDWRARVQRSGRVSTLELGPLSRAESARQIELLVGHVQSAEQVDRIHRRAGGHPLFTEQLVSGGGDGALPALLVDLLDRRIRGLTGPSWATARALAVADRPLGERALADVAGLTSSELVEALHDLADQRLLFGPQSAAQVALRHPLLAEAIRRRLTATETTEQHHRVAAVLSHDTDASAAEVAAHWRGAREPHLELEWTTRAAVQADARFAGVEAAELWRRALELWPGRATVSDPPLRRAAAYVAAIDACRRIGQSHRARALAHEALTRPDELSPLETAELLRRAAANTVEGPGHQDDRLRLIERALAIYRTLPPCEGLVHTLDLKANLLNREGQFAAASEVLDEASHALDGLDGGPLLRGLEASLAWQTAVTGDIEAGLARIRAVSSVRTSTPEPERDLYVALTHSDLLLMAGRPAPEVVAVAEQALAGARSWDLRGFEVTVLTFNAALAWCRAGRVARAAALVDPESDREATTEDWLLRLSRANVALLRGRADEAADLVASLAVLPWTEGDRDVVLIQALIDLWRGRPADATARLLAYLDGAPVVLVPGTRGTLLTTLAWAAADETSSPQHTRHRGVLHSSVAALPGQHADPFGPRAVPVDRAARWQWVAELARLEGTATVEAWTRAATEWDAFARPHDASYCRWRGAQTALAAGQATVAGRLLRRAAHDAREHVPLAAAIAETAAYAPQS
jgi:hypothetical protein